MRNDQIFVLLLVILLPMSGCFDGAVGDAEAEEGTEENTLQEVTAVNKIITIQVGPDEEVNMTLNGTALEFVGGWYCADANNYCSTTESLMIDITCDDPDFYGGKFFFNRANWFTPNPAGTECVINIENVVTEGYSTTIIYSFVEHPLA